MGALVYVNVSPIPNSLNILNFLFAIFWHLNSLLILSEVKRGEGPKTDSTSFLILMSPYIKRNILA